MLSDSDEEDQRIMKNLKNNNFDDSFDDENEDFDMGFI